MDFEQYKLSFEKAATDSGYSALNIKRCLDYAKVLVENNVPIIYNTTHLSALVGYKKSYIKKAVFYTSSFYTQYEIRKKNGGVRVISEPLPSLKDIQIWILNEILQNLKVSPFAKAYKKNTSLIDNVRFHKQQPMVVSIDIKDFFPSISTNSIQHIFRSIGYSLLISNLLAKLCTKDNCLPQGAPTSPLLSNIFFLNCDNRIAKFCIERGIKYTRYADDLTFSGDFDDEELLSFIRAEMQSLRLSINETKTKILTQSQRQIITGVVVNSKPQVAFYKRNKLRQDLFFIQKFGIDEHMAHTKIKRRNYLSHLLGKVNFVLHLNPEDKEFQQYKSYLVKLKRERER